MVGSSKHNEGLQYAQTELVANMTTSNEIKTRRWANQIGTLKRVGNTC